MNSKVLVVLALCLFGSTLAWTQDRGGAPGQGAGAPAAGGGRGRAQQPPPPKESDAPAIPGVTAPGTKVRLLATGEQNTQGAIALEDGTLLFTQPGSNRVQKLDPSGTVSTYLDTMMTYINSATLDPKGRVVGVKFNPDGGVMQLAPTRTMLVTKHEDKLFGRPNDIFADRKGGFYWSDDLGLPEQQIKSAVYYLRPDGQNVLATDEVAKPNGMVLSPDDKILYVGDGNGMFLMAFDVQPDGSLKNKRKAGTLEGGRTGVYPKDPFGRQPEDGLASVADGLAIDAAGRVYVTSSIGVQVISPDGKNLGTIPTTHPLQNIAFAGRDRKTLYLFGNGNMYEVSMLAQGVMGRPK